MPVNFGAETCAYLLGEYIKFSIYDRGISEPFQLTLTMNRCQVMVNLRCKSNYILIFDNYKIALLNKIQILLTLV